MSSSKNLEIAKTSFLNKSNSTFIEEMYMKFIENDPDLPLSWENYFRSLGEDLNSVLIRTISFMKTFSMLLILGIIL